MDLWGLLLGQGKERREKNGEGGIKCGKGEERRIVSGIREEEELRKLLLMQEP